jgi:hypothetical protein
MAGKFNVRKLLTGPQILFHRITSSSKPPEFLVAEAGADWRACSAPNNLPTELIKADSPFSAKDEKPVSELKATVRLRIP